MMTANTAGLLKLTKMTMSGKTAEVYYNHLAPMASRYEVFIDGVSGGANAGPKQIKVGSARASKLVPVIAWGGKMMELTAEEVRELGGLDAPSVKKASPAPRCRVCGGKVDYSEQYATRGYCGCQGE